MLLRACTFSECKIPFFYLATVAEVMVVGVHKVVQTQAGAHSAHALTGRILLRVCHRACA